MSSDDEDATRATDPRYIWDRTSAVYRRRPQYVAGRAMASQRAMPLDPGPGTQTSFATLRIFAGPPYENPYGGTPFANLLPSVHNYDSGGGRILPCSLRPLWATNSISLFLPPSLIECHHMAWHGGEFNVGEWGLFRSPQNRS